jgi:hypothetical protein
VVHLAFENDAGFLVHEVTGHQYLEWSVQSNGGNTGIVDLGDRRDCSVSFVHESLCSVSNVPGGREYDVLVHRAT